MSSQAPSAERRLADWSAPPCMAAAIGVNARVGSKRTITRPISKITAFGTEGMRSATGAGDPFASSSLCLCRWAKRNSVRFRDSARARTDGANHRREKGEEHHHGNHPVDTLANVRNRLAHEIPTQDQTRAPANSAHDIKRQVTAITHLRGSGHERTECAHDGHEARKDHCFPPVFLVKVVSALQMAALEKGGIRAAIKCLPCAPPDPIAKLIAGNRTEGDQQGERADFQRSGRAKHPCRNQERIAWQEKAHK